MGELILNVILLAIVVVFTIIVTVGGMGGLICY
jgi:hypothetical protein